MKGTETIKIEQPFEGDGNRIYYVNGGRCSGKVNKTINELVDYINNLQQENKQLKEVIDKVVLDLVNIDGNLSNSQLSDRICNLIDILKEVSE